MKQSQTSRRSFLALAALTPFVAIVPGGDELLKCPGEARLANTIECVDELYLWDGFDFFNFFGRLGYSLCGSFWRAQLLNDLGQRHAHGQAAISGLGKLSNKSR